MKLAAILLMAVAANGEISFRKDDSTGQVTIVANGSALTTADEPLPGWKFEDRWQREGELVKVTRRWTWQGAGTPPLTTLSIRFAVPLPMRSRPENEFILRIVMSGTVALHDMPAADLCLLGAIQIDCSTRRSPFEKTFYLQASATPEDVIATALRLHKVPQLKLSDVVRDHYKVLKSLWRDTGFQSFPDQTVFRMGNEGGASAPGYALQVLAPILNDPVAIQMAERSLSFLSSADINPDSFAIQFDYKKREWSGGSLKEQAEALDDFARAVRVGRARGAATSRWESLLLRGVAIHAHRILSGPNTGDDHYFRAALYEAYKIYQDPIFERALRKIRPTLPIDAYFQALCPGSLEEPKTETLKQYALLALRNCTKPDPAAPLRNTTTVLTNAARLAELGAGMH